ncbi:SdpI family protein [Streptomyces sp. NPDC087440]|uniref:SdpI family protein n=1 Tax=Streptomyces sp. NPDC087440 TaxID=3365790 RepID=UPI0038191BA5
MDPVAGWVCGVGLLVLGASVHYLRKHVGTGAGGVGRNAAIGIRTKATMASDAAWERGHAAAGPLLTATFRTAYVVGAVTVLVTLVVGSGGSPAVLAVPLTGFVAALGLLVAASVRANAAARDLSGDRGLPG